MKKILAAISAFILSTSLYAQEVTKFLGIPVDGTKAEMIQKLKAKGFTSNAYDRNILEGEFNGEKVNIHVVTNNNKVYRIMVCDKNSIDETSIKIRFNNLCRQFKNNDKYMPAIEEEQTLSDDENISYEMTVNKKRYEAVFYQLPSLGEMIKIKDTWLNMTEEERKENVKESLKEIVPRCVWFMISEFHGKYYIVMFYDNEYNRANGEDL